MPNVYVNIFPSMFAMNQSVTLETLSLSTPYSEQLYLYIGLEVGIMQFHLYSNGGIPNLTGF